MSWQRNRQTWDQRGVGPTSDYQQPRQSYQEKFYGDDEDEDGATGYSGYSHKAPSSEDVRTPDQERIWQAEMRLTTEQRRARYRGRYVTLDHIPEWRQTLLEGRGKATLAETELRVASAAHGRWGMHSSNDCATIIEKLKNVPRPAPDAELNRKVSLYRGDSTQLEVDAIVNAANSSLLGGGGIDGRIHQMAGGQLYNYNLDLHGCPTGFTKISPGFCLPARYVLGTVGPIGLHPEELESCYATIFQLVDKYHIRSVSLCGVSTGIFGYPVPDAVMVAVPAVRRFLETHRDVERIVFVVYQPEEIPVYDYPEEIPVYDYVRGFTLPVPAPPPAPAPAALQPAIEALLALPGPTAASYLASAITSGTDPKTIVSIAASLNLMMADMRAGVLAPATATPAPDAAPAPNAPAPDAAPAPAPEKTSIAASLTKAFAGVTPALAISAVAMAIVAAIMTTAPAAAPELTAAIIAAISGAIGRNATAPDATSIRAEKEDEKTMGNDGAAQAEVPANEKEDEKTMGNEGAAPAEVPAHEKEDEKTMGNDGAAQAEVPANEKKTMVNDRATPAEVPAEAESETTMDKEDDHLEEKKTTEEPKDEQDHADQTEGAAPMKVEPGHGQDQTATATTQTQFEAEPAHKASEEATATQPTSAQPEMTCVVGKAEPPVRVTDIPDAMGAEAEMAAAVAKVRKQKKNGGPDAKVKAAEAEKKGMMAIGRIQQRAGGKKKR
ncbi:putative O-acetyl-ADP-ribose deacetylase MACROD2 [Paratrimastix pyriformis]|uniref:O-acetyl-ADP-ribose deacetylase MACROD2 n=1 Tax=Paratrimastix pyriformis TaxID=342808 RepID=A0ABQ8UTI7_9EUKA|nr:putative O-acetyl-ADP-ribose deacetylase MACROD2 [Paratrimastix pyriformis]